jgi:hypothetical protein
VSGQSSHGDGRHMTVAEAIERRTRMIRFHGSLDLAQSHGDETLLLRGHSSDSPSRHWSWNVCLMLTSSGDRICANVADDPEDVAVVDGQIVPVCPTCRGVA